MTPESTVSKPAIIPSSKPSETQLNQIKSEIPSTPTEPIHSTPERISKSKSEDLSHSEPNTPSLVPHETSAIHTPKTERHYGLSYGISELPTVISQSATRTGRQIRAPKSLDV